MAKPTIVTRAGKGSALTWTEGDSNLTNLQNATIAIKADTGGTDVVSDLNGTVTLVAGTNVTITGDNSAKTVTINSTASGGATTLDGLSDVVITAAATNDVLVYNGTNWVDTQANTLTVSAASTATTATGATNINISTIDGNTSDTTLYPVLVGAASTGNQLPHIDSAVLSFNASTNILSSTGFAGALNGTVGATTANTGAFTTLTASGAVTLSPSSAAVAISPTGTGTVAISPAGALTINPTTASTINNTSIGATTASTGRFTTVQSTIATGTAPFTVASTTNVANLNASSLNGATFAAPGAIGSTTASTGAFTTLSASSTVSGTGFSTYLASPPAIGGTTAAAGTFTALTSTGLTTLKTYKETISAGGSQTSAYTPDYSLGTVHTVTLTGNVTFAAPTNMAAGNSLTLILTQDATGGRTGTWNASYKWLGGTPTLSTTGASIDVVNIFYDGTNYITGISKQDTSSSVSGLTVTAAGELRLADTDSSNYVGFKSPGTVSANKVWTLPAADGTANQVLKTDGAGVLGWATAGGGGATIAVITQDAIKGTLITGSTYRQTISEYSDPSGIVTVSGDQFTVGAGTYIVEFVGVNKCTTVGAIFQHGLYNVTGAANIDNFAGGLVNDGTNTTRWVFQWSYVISPASSNTYEFRCLLDATSNTVALVGTSARFRITKIG